MPVKMSAVAFLAVFVLGVGASGAFAVEFKAETYPVKISVTQKEGGVAAFKIGGAK